MNAHKNNFCVDWGVVIVTVLILSHSVVPPEAVELRNITRITAEIIVDIFKIYRFFTELEYKRSRPNRIWYRCFIIDVFSVELFAVLQFRINSKWNRWIIECIAPFSFALEVFLCTGIKTSACQLNGIAQRGSHIVDHTLDRVQKLLYPAISSFESHFIWKHQKEHRYGYEYCFMH